MENLYRKSLDGYIKFHGTRAYAKAMRINVYTEDQVRFQEPSIELNTDEVEVKKPKKNKKGN